MPEDDQEGQELVDDVHFITSFSMWAIVFSRVRAMVCRTSSRPRRGWKSAWSSMWATTEKMAVKPMLAGQEIFHGDLVGRVEDGAGVLPLAQHVVGHLAGKGSACGSTAKNSSRCSAGRSRLRAGAGDALGVGQRVEDRQLHVGDAELGQHRGIDEFHQGMDHALGMDDDVDALRARGRTGGWPR